MNKNRPRQISLAALVYAVDTETAEMSWYTLRPQDTVNTILCLPPENVIQALKDHNIEECIWKQQIYFRRFGTAKSKSEQIKRSKYESENYKSVG